MLSNFLLRQHISRIIKYRVQLSTFFLRYPTFLLSLRITEEVAYPHKQEKLQSVNLCVYVFSVIRRQKKNPKPGKIIFNNLIKVNNFSVVSLLQVDTGSSELLPRCTEHVRKYNCLPNISLLLHLDYQ